MCVSIGATICADEVRGGLWGTGEEVNSNVIIETVRLAVVGVCAAVRIGVMRAEMDVKCCGCRCCNDE